MKYLFQIYILLILLLSAVSCKEQKKTENPRKTKPQPDTTQIVNTDRLEIDSYFTGTQTFTSATGPRNITRNILQDKQGNIWLATWEGLIKYDGQIFTNVTNIEGLRRFRVFELLEDRKGDLWFATIGAGVYHYDGSTFTNFTTEEGLINNRVTCIYEDRNGIIWFGTEGGISQYNGTSFRNFTTAEGLLSNDVNAIIEDQKGNFWIGTRGTACWYDGQNFMPITTQDGSIFINIRTIIKDQKGNLWLGGNNGLWRYASSTFTNYTKNFVGYIYEDRSGNIWTSSVGAIHNEWVLSRFDAKSLNSEEITATPIKTEENMFFGMEEDQKGHLWLGHLRGVYRFDDGKLFTSF